jgi:tetratricopeptide (TPR) repeat protein
MAMVSGETIVEKAEAALHRARQNDDKNDEVRALDSCVKAYLELSDTYEAVKFANEALKLQRALGDTKAEAQSLLQIGEMYFTMNDLQQALNFEEDALRMFTTLADKPGKDAASAALTRVHMARGHPESAPHRSKGLAALDELMRTVKAKDVTKFHVLMARLEKNHAVSKEDIADALGRVLEEDYMPTAQFYKETLDMQDLVPSSKAVEMPKKAMYFHIRAHGGLMYGPAFRFSNNAHANVADEEGYCALQISDDRDQWESELAYNHGLLDGSIQLGMVVSSAPKDGSGFSQGHMEPS